MEDNILNKPITTPGQIREALLAGFLTTGTLLDVVSDGLKATKHITHDGKLVEVSDHAMRLKFSEYLTYNVEGMPVKRQEIISRSMTTEDELDRMLEKSPAFLKAMKRKIDSLVEDSAG